MNPHVTCVLQALAHPSPYFPLLVVCVVELQFGVIRPTTPDRLLARAAALQRAFVVARPPATRNHGETEVVARPTAAHLRLVTRSERTN